jgi:hypothetical protein
MLMCLVVISSVSSFTVSADPAAITILYTSDELGYLEPCG